MADATLEENEAKTHFSMSDNNIKLYSANKLLMQQKMYQKGLNSFGWNHACCNTFN